MEDSSMLRMNLPVILTFILLVSTNSAWSGDDLRQGKKLIEWGWDEPDTKFMRSNIEQMEKFPFDGLVFHVTGAGNLTWGVWGNHKFAFNDFQQSIDDLKATKFRRFTDRFL